MKKNVLIQSTQPAQPHAKVRTVQKPLYQQVLDALRDDILKGLFPVGSQLPTEGELAERFGVSRHTVREALRQLRSDDLVVSRQGAGTIVASAQDHHVYSQEIKSISDLIEYASVLRYHVDHSEMIVSDLRLADAIGITPEQKWLRIDGLRYEEGNSVPMCRTVMYVHADYAGVGRLIGHRKSAVYQLIEDIYGERINEVEQIVTAYPAPTELITRLEMKNNTVIVEVMRTYRTISKKIAEVAISQYPSDRFRFTMTLRRTRA